MTEPPMVRESLLADAFDLIGTKWDDWGDECCFHCIDEPWHRERFTTVARGKSSPTHARCGCACHRIRTALGYEDGLSEWGQTGSDALNSGSNPAATKPST